jgi:hypothetical protein
VAQIDELVGALQIDCGWEHVTASTYAGDASRVDAVEEEAVAARVAGLDVHVTSDVPLPFAVASAVCLEDQRQLDAVRNVRGLAAAVDGDGSRVFESTAAPMSRRARRAASSRSTAWP